MHTPREPAAPLDVAQFEYRDEIGDDYHCRIRVFPTESDSIIVATEYTRDDVPARMRTLTHEIATDFRRSHHLTDQPFTWIEHFDDRTSAIASAIGGLGMDSGESFFLVTFSEHGTQLSRPIRTPISKNNVESLIGQSLA